MKCVFRSNEIQDYWGKRQAQCPRGPWTRENQGLGPPLRLFLPRSQDQSTSPRTMGVLPSLLPNSSYSQYLIHLCVLVITQHRLRQSGSGVGGLGRVKRTHLESQLCLLLVMRLWTRCSTSQCSRQLIYKKGTLPTSKGGHDCKIYSILTITANPCQQLLCAKYCAKSF